MSAAVSTLRILVVDDDPAVRAAYERILGDRRARDTGLDDLEAGLFGAPATASPASPTSTASRRVIEVVCASQGQEGARLAGEAAREGRPFAVAFIDMRMPPGWDGLVTAERIRAEDPEVQIVIATAYSDRAWNEIVSRLGRVDSLLLLKKPFDTAEVAQMAAALGEKWRLARAAAEELAESNRLSASLVAANLELGRQVDERRAAEQRLHRHAYFDPLTGLPNRLRLVDRLESALAVRDAEPDCSFAVLYLDLDGFKLVNDSLGHQMGDRVLVEIARRLYEGLRASDSVTRSEHDGASRLGGDEFVIVLEGIADAANAVAVAERLLRLILQPIDLGVQQVVLSASVGVVVAESRHASAEDVLRDADLAMYRAKFERLRIAVFDPSMLDAARRRLRIESDLRRAVQREHFSLVYQPIFNIGSGRIVALEALARWDHPDYPVRSPGEFIPVAEETGLIVPLGRWLLEQACRALVTLREAAPGAEDVSVSVNVSRRQLLDSRLAADVAGVLERTGLPANRLDLEITESAILGGEDAALRRLTELRDMGVGMHLDDFGTGYSALSCLQKFPIDRVKIDRSFITTLGESSRSAAIVEAIVPLAHRLQMRVTVEGVETEAQLAAVREIGIDFVQGYLLSHPVSLAEAIELIRTQSAYADRRSRAPQGGSQSPVARTGR